MSGVIKIPRIARITKTVISKQMLSAGASTTDTANHSTPTVEVISIRVG